MATVQIMLRDTSSGHVDVETTVMDWRDDSKAKAMADRINAFIAEIATEVPRLELVKE